jgi:iron-sulfur cluster assembly protein
MNPINLTDAAITHIKNMLAKNPAAIGFRLSIKKTGCSGYAYLPNIIETPINNDIHFMANDLPVYVDPACLELIKDVVIDYVSEEGPGLKQKRLVFINPNEKCRCGCGESFTIE